MWRVAPPKPDSGKTAQNHLYTQDFRIYDKGASVLMLCIGIIGNTVKCLNWR